MERYTKGKRSSAQALDYFYRNNCLELRPDAPQLTRQSHIILEALILFYESDAFPREQRIERLSELGETNYYPSLVLASMYANEDKSELVEEIARLVSDRSGGMKLESGPLMESTLRPYCLKMKLSACTKVTDMTSSIPPYLDLL